MRAEYIEAIETRAAWCDLLKSHRNGGFFSSAAVKDGEVASVDLMVYNCLHYAEFYFINKKFYELVDLARKTIPNDLEFEETWLLSKSGFIWFEEPVQLPAAAFMPAYGIKFPAKTRFVLRAIGWLPVIGKDGKPATEFLCFIDERDSVINVDSGEKLNKSSRGKQSFNTWSYFGIHQSDKLCDKVEQLEETYSKDDSCRYVESEKFQMHELRWIYTTLHLMAQRLAITVHQDTDRATKRRAAREGKVVCDHIEVISLRKMEADRQREVGDNSEKIDWQWRWSVTGHWRNQYFSASKTHKQVWIEGYIKGPDDKPLKQMSEKLFVARR